jgi:hypothetical protein
MASTTACTALRSASPEYVGGVPTAMNSSRACSSASAIYRSRNAGDAVLGDQLGQAGLVDRDLAVLQPLDLGCVDVDAPHLVVQLGKAGRGDEADVAGTDDTDGLT